MYCNKNKKILLVVIILIIASFAVGFFTGRFDFNKKELAINNDNSNNIAEENVDVNDEKNNIESGINETKPEEDSSSEVSTDDKIQSIINSMSIEEKVGQMFFVRCPETEQLNPATEYHVGGYLLFARDFDGKSKEDVIANINSYQEASKIKLFIGVDEEGGTVTRVSRYQEFRSERFKSPRDLYAAGGMELIESDSTEKCNLLTELGINVNYAPVCDVSTNTEDYMYSRSIGLSAEETGDFVAKIVKNMQVNGVGSVLKHFPGYGSNSDTHTGMSIDNRTIEEFENCDLIPFKRGIEEGAQCILVSHNIITCMDDSMPSSLSINVHNYLRNNMNYQGVIITDDLAMDAIQEYVDPEKAAIYAVKAGNDMIVCTDYKKQIPNVLQAVKSGEISENTINESVRRILEWKMQLLGNNI